MVKSKNFQHIPGTYLRLSTKTLWRNSFHYGGLGIPGVCWGSLRLTVKFRPFTGWHGESALFLLLKRFVSKSELESQTWLRFLKTDQDGWIIPGPKNIFWSWRFGDVWAKNSSKSQTSHTQKTTSNESFHVNHSCFKHALKALPSSFSLPFFVFVSRHLQRLETGCFLETHGT